MRASLKLAGERVLVTGGLGFIGSNLAGECVRRGAEVTILDSLDPLCGGNLANIAELKDDVRLVRGDIRSDTDVTGVLTGTTIVFNCAAYTSHIESLRHPLTFEDVNCGGLLTVLEGIRRSDRPIRFVQVGTSTQVGPMVETPVTERHPEFPTDMYSATKTSAEKYTLVYGMAYGIPVTVVRLANVYGPRANIGSSAFGFINYFIGLALRDRDLTVYGDGAQIRTVTFVDDVVGALLLAAVSESATGQVMFAAAEGQHTIRELADLVVRHIGSGRVRSVPWPKERLAMEIGDASISSARIGELLGWKANTDLQDGLTKTREYYSRRLGQYVS